MKLNLHITERHAWQQAQKRGIYRGDTLDTEGFIHCSAPDTIIKVVNRLFRGRTGLVLLCIDEDRVQAEVRYEGPCGGDYYPHVYGPLNLDSIINVFDFPPEPDGAFVVPDVWACPFCSRQPDFVGQLISENENCGFYLGNEAVLRGSGIIIPKAHRLTVFDLTPEEWRSTYELLQVAKSHIVKVISPDGFSVGWNCGDVGGQYIHHAHLHVIPRFSDEPYAGRGIRSWLKNPENLRPAYRAEYEPR